MEVPGADRTQAVIIQCSNSTSCQNYKLENIEIVPEVLCASSPRRSHRRFAPTSILLSTRILGFICQNGTYIATK